jgi:hypothetical protein
MTYDLLSISITLIVAYLSSYILYRKDYIKKSTHIRLWNILILITFLVSAGAGLVLLSLAEYGVALPISQDLLYWHVQIAIAMFWIAIFHIHSYWMSSPGKKSDEIQDPHEKSPEKFKGKSPEKSKSSLKSGTSPGKSTDNSNEKQGRGLK